MSPNIVEVCGIVDTSDIKRFRSDISITTTCPVCGRIISTNLKEQYLSYPKSQSTDSIGMYCTSCDATCTLPIRIKDISISIEYDPNEIKEEL